MSMYNVNTWATPGDPTSLVTSIEWGNVDWPVIKLKLNSYYEILIIFNRLNK